jgi:hypothetical protein
MGDMVQGDVYNSTRRAELLGESYLSVGGISCPDTHGCLALGSAAQSAPTTPIYRLEGNPCGFVLGYES